MTTLYHPDLGLLQVRIHTPEEEAIILIDVEAMQVYTHRLFATLCGSRMPADKLDFAYLFEVHMDGDDVEAQEQEQWWDRTRLWASSQLSSGLSGNAHLVNATEFGAALEYPPHIVLIRDNAPYGKLYRFVGWKDDQPSAEEEDQLKETYRRFDFLDVSLPLLVAEDRPPCVDFLHPAERRVRRASEDLMRERNLKLLMPEHSYVKLVLPLEAEMSLLVPSILPYIAVARTAASLRAHLLMGPQAPPGLLEIPLSLIRTAVCTPAAQEPMNY